ncbi:MAG: hypothetical protein R3C09_05795 [Pirellulaceae bacterium]
MSRPMSEYNCTDWLRLRPVLHALKSRRYRLMDEHALSVPSINADLIDKVAGSLNDQQALVTIAFNDSESIALQIRLLRQFVPHAIHIVVDNSSNASLASSIEKVTNNSDSHYVRIHHNPWTGRNPSRSHGFAMNWAYRNVLRSGRPRHFGFLDHDLYPTENSDPFDILETTICGGDIRRANTRWFLWAGYCMFDQSRLGDHHLNFGLDWFAGLDTGGANWEILYRNIDVATLYQRPITAEQVWPDVPLQKAYFERRGTWLHEVGLDGDPDLQKKKQRVLRDRLTKSQRIAA